MTVIFQLFCVDDLKQIPPDRLAEFQETVRDALRKHPIDAPGVRDDVDPKISRQIDPEIDPSQNPPQQIIDALEKRFNEVSQQLKSPPSPNPSRPTFNFDQLSSQHFGRKTPNEQKEHTILQWAISCEVNNYKFYYPLLRIRDEVYDWFFKKTGQHPKGPDSRYSPFHSQHPLYNLLQQLKQRGQPPTEGTSDSAGL